MDIVYRFISKTYFWQIVQGCMNEGPFSLRTTKTAKQYLANWGPFISVLLSSQISDLIAKIIDF
jgi:hypothetical protein